MTRKYMVAMGILANKRRAEFPAVFSPEMSDRNISS
ncbi:hypothetical protein J2772_003958 [Chryseobacterium jejuense]|nr:hypothetical protein [Chryseobacterium jejuense]